MNVSEFLSLGRPLVDVRSPGEFAQGHIPGARNVPLFSDEERARVGTTYKQVGPEEAFVLGLEIVGPKLADLYRESGTDVAVYCWRGGMRSEAFARLVGGAPRLEGGYKAFRRWALEMKPPELRVLGGFSGSGKTEKLKEIEGQVLDLEALANHRGSLFGSLGKQPTQEQFENRIAVELAKFDDRPVWVEDESRLVGRCKIPDQLFEAMCKAPVYILDVPLEKRLDRLMKEYSQVTREQAVAIVEKLKKRLGTERASEALKAERREAVRILLDYYDRSYEFCLEKRGKKVYSFEEYDKE